jgi:integrase
MTSISLLEGRLRLYKREGSPCWQCSTYLGTRNWRATPKQVNFELAKDVAEGWYWDIREKFAAKLIRPMRPFRDVAAEFFREYETLTRGERNANYVKSHADRIRLYLDPFFGHMAADKITTAKIEAFWAWRQNLATQKHGKPAAHNTIQHDIITLRMVLKLAERKSWIDHLPQFEELFPPRRTISYRGWFSAKDYFKLCQATWACAENPPTGVRQEVTRQLHDYVVFMANTGLRPDEASRLEFRDIVIDNEEAEDPILVIDVRGKRGIGYCKSMPSAVRAYRRIMERAKLTGGGKPLPTDKVFLLDHRDLFNRILGEKNMKLDNDGRPRTAYSLRHTYVCLRLLNGADIFQIAMNCRTSVEILEKYYAAHIRTHIDASAINKGRVHDTEWLEARVTLSGTPDNSL